MASFRWITRYAFKNYCCHLFFTGLFVTLIKTSVAINSNSVKKVHKIFAIDKDNLPTAHIDEMINMSPVFILTYNKVNPNISSAIISLYTNKLSVVISNNNVLSPRCGDRDANCFKILNFVGIISDPRSVNITLWTHIFDRRWNTRSKIIIWITEHLPYTETEKLLKRFWSHECVNVVIIMKNVNSNMFDIYSYNPFIRDNSNRIGLVYKLSYDDPFFPNKIKNLYGHKIRISMFSRPPHSILKNFKELGSGSEVEVLKGIRSTFNCTLDLITSEVDAGDYVVLLNNGTEEGPLGDLLINKSDMLGNTYYINMGFGNNIEFLNPFFYTDYIVIVPKGIGATLALQLYFHIISFLLDPLYILMILCFSILAFYLYRKKEKYFILASWELLLFQHFKHFDNGYFDKYFRLMWIVWATIFVSLFQGVVYKYLSLPKSVADIHTIEELYDNGIHLTITDDVVTPLHNSDNVHKQELAERATKSLTMYDCYNELEKYNNVSCGADYTMGLYYFKKLLMTKYPKAHIVEEPLDKFWIGYIVKDGFPYSDNVNFVVKQFIENGFFMKWGHDSMNLYHLMPDIDIYEVVPLSMSYFDITFLFLYFGHIASSSIFFIEIIIVYFRNKYVMHCLPIIHNHVLGLQKQS